MAQRNGRAAPAKTPSELEQLLQTGDPEQQVAQVKALIEAVRNPPITLMVTFDPRTGRVSVVPAGQNIDYEAAHQILGLGQQALRQQERERLSKAAGEQTTDGTESAAA